jgi:hypothetical protein
LLLRGTTPPWIPTEYLDVCGANLKPCLELQEMDRDDAFGFFIGTWLQFSTQVCFWHFVCRTWRYIFLVKTCSHCIWMYLISKAWLDFWYVLIFSGMCSSQDWATLHGTILVNGSL